MGDRMSPARLSGTFGRQQTFWPEDVSAVLGTEPRPSALAKLRPTVVYDSFWRFAEERQAIFFRRARGDRAPWTDDEILREFKFTNAYRACDRVSQYLIRHVIFSGDQAPEEVFFRTLLFKFFNKIETWELLVRSFGTPRVETFRVERFDRVLSAAIESGHAIYSAAYIMPSGGGSYARKHQLHLSLLSRMIADGAPERIVDAQCMKDVYRLLLAYPTIGPFLAYQYATDLNYSDLLYCTEMEFVVPGPGAIDGIHKCFEAASDFDASEIIRMVTEEQAAEFDRLGLDFQQLWGRPLQLIDCQNLFCEISKYARVRHPEHRGVANRTRIKQKYKPNPQPIAYWFPPKWGINEIVGIGRNPSEPRR